MTSRGRAFTVIELLIVVSLLLALGSLVIVSGFTWSERERVEATEKGISASVEEARAMALRLGRPVRLVAIGSGTGKTRLTLEPWADSFESDQPENEETVNHARVIYELPDGLSIAHAEDSDSFAPHETDIFVQSESAPIALLDVFPDGQAKLSDGSWQLESDGAVHVPSLDSWAASLRFEAVELEEFADFAGVPADEEPAL